MKGCLKYLTPAGLIIVALCLAPFILRLSINQRYDAAIYTEVEKVPPRRVAIVFGAYVFPSGRLSDALRDRVDAAIALYKAGKVQKLLFSGDNRFLDYNEPGRMREYALTQGVDNANIVLDYAGRRTYDTCYRAEYIFGVTDAVLVTQKFHLPRALFLCDNMGIDAVGFVADRHRYSEELWYELRETGALLFAWWDVNIGHSRPVLGEKEPIEF